MENEPSKAKSWRVLLVNPVLPPSFWSFTETNRLLGTKALMPPLGLITVAALLPKSWSLRLVDLNVRPLEERDWQWAEMVMITGMMVQRSGVLDLISEARRRNKLSVVGGPYVTSFPDEALAVGCDFLVRNEGENTIPLFLAALESGQTRGVFENTQKPEMMASPVPRFDLLDLDAYSGLSIQTSRGCPFKCEFCHITVLHGRQPRYKAPGQVLAELETILQLGWQGEMFIADDNFIGNKLHAKAILDALIPWNRSRGEPFVFGTQTSANLGQDKGLIDLMTAANFSHVFVGIESPDTDVLKRAQKQQNVQHPLSESLHNINRNGLSVIGSFIIGFDGEKSGAGGRIVALIEDTAIPIAMINILQAAPDTPLWDRLQREHRLRDISDGDSVVGMMNFIPTRPEAEIMAEYVAVWDRLYEPSRFYDRVHRYILERRPTRRALGVEEPVDTLVAIPPKRYRAGTITVLGALLWLRAVVSRHPFRLGRLVFEICRRNPSRVWQFLVLCVMGENMFGVRDHINQALQPIFKAGGWVLGREPQPGSDLHARVASQQASGAEKLLSGPGS